MFKLKVGSSFAKGCSSNLLLWLAAAGMAIAEPVLRVFGATPTLFSHHNLDSPLWILLFAAAAVFIVPVAIVLVLAVLQRISRRLAAFFSVVVVTVLALIWGLQVARWSLGIDSVPLVIFLAVTIAFIVVYALLRWPIFTDYFKFLALVPVASAFMFIGISETSSLAWRKSSVAQDEVVAKDQPSVLFVLLDEFPLQMLLDEEGAIDAGLYPNLARFAESSTWYKNYTVLADYTKHSVPSLLSGKRPRDVLPTARAYPTNLFALLAPTHHLTAYETISRLCTYDKCSEGPPGTLVKAEPQFPALLLRVIDFLHTRVTPWSSREIARDDF